MKFSKKLHHAYLIEGDIESIIANILSFLENKLKFKTKANPDFFRNRYDVFSINEARKIKSIQSKKAFGNKKIFVFSFNSMTREAQNSLLKLFEEPTEGTHFFIVTRSSDILLPTLKSRMEVIVFNSLKKNLSQTNVGEFLKANKKKRLNLVKEIIKNKDKSGAILFLDEIEKTLALQLEVEPLNREIVLTLGEITKNKKYLNTRSSSIKMILEHIALII